MVLKPYVFQHFRNLNLLTSMTNTMLNYDLGTWILRPKAFNCYPLLVVVQQLALVCCKVFEGKAEYAAFAGQWTSE